MYFLSKNMCFLWISTVFDEKAKKSGPAECFFSAFLCRETPHETARFRGIFSRRIANGRGTAPSIRGTFHTPKFANQKRKRFFCHCYILFVLLYAILCLSIIGLHYQMTNHPTWTGFMFIASKCSNKDPLVHSTISLWDKTSILPDLFFIAFQIIIFPFRKSDKSYCPCPSNSAKQGASPGRKTGERTDKLNVFPGLMSRTWCGRCFAGPFRPFPRTHGPDMTPTSHFAGHSDVPNRDRSRRTINNTQNQTKNTFIF